MYPILFSVKIFDKDYHIYSYGVFLILAVICGVLLFYWLLHKRGIKTVRIFDNILWTLLAGFIGARLFYVLFHLRFYVSNWREIFQLWLGGLDIFGALIGGFVVLFAWLYLKKRQELWSYLDCGLIAAMLALVIGKIGSFLMGSDLGKPWSGLLALKFPEEQILRHPVQIYESIIYFLIFLVLFLVFEKTHRTSGYIFFLGLILFGAGRFLLEFFRVSDIILYREITVVHLISFIVLIIGIAGIKRFISS